MSYVEMQGKLVRVVISCKIVFADLNVFVREICIVLVIRVFYFIYFFCLFHFFNISVIFNVFEKICIYLHR